MLSKIKDLVHTKELVDEITSTVNSHNEAVNEMTGEFSALRTELDAARKIQTEALKEFSKAQSKIVDLEKEFKQEIESFKTLKKQMQKKVHDDVETQTKKLMEDMQNQISGYKLIESDMKNVHSRISDTHAEIDKLNRISKIISEKDFELVKFVKLLEKSGNEKLELLRKIDNLERLIAAMQKGRGEKRARY